MDRSELHKEKRPKFYIVDGNGYIYRAFFALPKMNNSKGLPTNAVYGFTNMIRKLLTEEKPEFIAVAFDSREKTFRHDSYVEYKIDRKAMPDDLQQQIPYIRKICEALNLPVLEKPGFEADDIIATLMQQCKDRKLIGVIVTSDKDLLQLVDDERGIYTLDPMKDYFVYNEKAVEEKWGVKPDRIAEMMSIMGDSIDNIPGVKGIGPKGALELIQKFGTVENLLSHIDQIEKKALKQKIEEGRENLLLSRKLVELRKDVPVDIRVEDLKAGEANTEAARDLFLNLEFYSIVNQYLSDHSSRNTSYRAITTEKELQSLIKTLQNASVIAICWESDSPSPFFGSLTGFTFTVKPKEGNFVSFHQDPTLLFGTMDADSVLKALKPVLENNSIRKIVYNLKELILFLRKHDIQLNGASQDPMLLSYVLNPTRHAHKIEDLAKEYFQYQMRDIKTIIGSGQKQIALCEASIEARRDYACERTDLSFELTPRLEQDLEKEEMLSVYRDIELPVLHVLADVEWNGVKIDTAVLSRLDQEMTKNLDRLVAEIYEMAGEKFNINSPKQIGEILFHKLKIPMIKRTRKTKDYSTSVEVLEELAAEHELPQKILEYRQFSKLKSTYVDALPLMIHPKTGRVHTNYQQTVAATGRLSSVDPNLQNIPIRTPWGRLIRDAFIADQGCFLISADYSQIELRVMAHLSRDETLIDSFLKEEDIHARTASEVFGVPMEQMTKEIRNQAKAINYGINYGQSPFGLAQLLGIDQKEAKQFIDRYFTRYPGVKAYVDETLAYVQEHGYVTTMFGRRRYIPEIRSRDRNVFMAAQRAAINTPLQGTSADLIKLAMIDVQKALKEKKLKCKMTMQVHDELVFEVPEAEKEAAAELIREKMQNVCQLVVPLTVDLSIGRNWREAK